MGYNFISVYRDVQSIYMMNLVTHYKACYPRAQASRVIGEREKRARRYLVMFMETRDMYIQYVRLFLIRMRALVFYKLNSRARKRKTF